MIVSSVEYFFALTHIKKVQQFSAFNFIFNPAFVVFTSEECGLFRGSCFDPLKRILILKQKLIKDKFNCRYNRPSLDVAYNIYIYMHVCIYIYMWMHTTVTTIDYDRGIKSACQVWTFRPRN